MSVSQIRPVAIEVDKTLSRSPSRQEVGEMTSYLYHNRKVILFLKWFGYFPIQYDLGLMEFKMHICASWSFIIHFLKLCIILLFFAILRLDMLFPTPGHTIIEIMFESCLENCTGAIKDNCTNLSQTNSESLKSNSDSHNKKMARYFDVILLLLYGPIITILYRSFAPRLTKLCKSISRLDIDIAQEIQEIGFKIKLYNGKWLVVFMLVLGILSGLRLVDYYVWWNEKNFVHMTCQEMVDMIAYWLVWLTIFMSTTIFEVILTISATTIRNRLKLVSMLDYTPIRTPEIAENITEILKKFHSAFGDILALNVLYYASESVVNIFRIALLSGESLEMVRIISSVIKLYNITFRCGKLTNDVLKYGEHLTKQNTSQNDTERRVKLFIISIIRVDLFHEYNYTIKCLNIVPILS